MTFRKAVMPTATGSARKTEFFIILLKFSKEGFDFWVPCLKKQGIDFQNCEARQLQLKSVEAIGTQWTCPHVMLHCHSNTLQHRSTCRQKP